MIVRNFNLIPKNIFFFTSDITLEREGIFKYFSKIKGNIYNN